MNQHCTSTNTTKPGIRGTLRGVIELLQSKEHGKTARTIAITMCVFGAVTAISAAATLQRWIEARRPVRVSKTVGRRLGHRRVRSFARLQNGSRT